MQTQVLMLNNDAFRSIVKQATGLMIFNSLRARQSLKHLSIQLYDKANFLPAVSADILKDNGPYVPLYLDLRNTAKEELRVRAGLPGIHDTFTVYQI